MTSTKIVTYDFSYKSANVCDLFYKMKGEMLSFIQLTVQFSLDTLQNQE